MIKQGKRELIILTLSMSEHLTYSELNIIFVDFATNIYTPVFHNKAASFCLYHQRSQRKSNKTGMSYTED
jgi:hypothetical protein